jgi:hypothetical protein
MTNFNNVTQTDLDGTNLTFNAWRRFANSGRLSAGGHKSPLPLSGGIWYYGILE